MRDIVTTSLRQIAKDRAVLVTFMGLIVLCVVIAIYCAVRIKASEIYVVTRYTSYGTVNFTQTPWYNTIVFVIFFLFVAVAHTAIGMKLYQLKDRKFALYFGWFSVGIVLFAAVNFLRIINIAFPL